MKHIIILISLLLLLSGCHTTSRLGEGEVLYTGVKKLKVEAADTIEVPSGINDNINLIIDVPANNSLYSPYVRWPLPVGLYLYNHWDEDSKGLKGWIYRKFAEEPVLISDVRPDLRMKMVEDMLDKNGYFGSVADYDILYDKKNPRKARVNYTIHLAPPKRIAKILLLDDTTAVSSEVNRYVKRDNYLKEGMIFCEDSLSEARTRLSNRLRNRGYYYFRPEYIMFYADTLMIPGKAVVKVAYADNVPEKGLRKYYVGEVRTLVMRNGNDGTPDSMMTNRGMVVVMEPSRLRKNLIPSCVTLKKGDEVRMRRVTSTQTYLSRLGIFNYISITPTPFDSISNDTLDFDIACRFDKPLEIQVETNVTSKSNSYLGPGLSVSVTNRNIFGGGERLSVKADGAYEWQIGKVDGKRSNYNSYELGVQAELAFPRLLLPQFVPITNRDLAWTRITLGGTMMNRPKFFKMVQFDFGLNYDWSGSRYSKNQFTLFGLKYNKLLSTTAEFDATMEENPAIALSFQNQFIPKLGYTYTYDRSFGAHRDDQHFTLQLSFLEGGNIFSGIWSLAGVKENKQLFGTPFSQFVKATMQAVYSKRLVGEHRLVSRIYFGAAHAYGNSQEVPYSEQFYVGGANSIRAFAVRSIGPGSYHSDKTVTNGFYDQTGTFRFEMNLEYRFPLLSMLKGALFVDAGNVWLLKDDPMRPGAALSSHFFKDLALGTGVGVRFDMGMLVVRGDLGIGLHLPYTTPHKGYFNVGKFSDSLAFNLAIGYPF